MSVDAVRDGLAGRAVHPVLSLAPLAIVALRFGHRASHFASAAPYPAPSPADGLRVCYHPNKLKGERPEDAKPMNTKFSFYVAWEGESELEVGALRWVVGLPGHTTCTRLCTQCGPAGIRIVHCARPCHSLQAR